MVTTRGSKKRTRRIGALAVLCLLLVSGGVFLFSRWGSNNDLARFVGDQYFPLRVPASYGPVKAGPETGISVQLAQAVNSALYVFLKSYPPEIFSGEGLPQPTELVSSELFCALSDPFWKEATVAFFNYETKKIELDESSIDPTGSGVFWTALDSVPHEIYHFARYRAGKSAKHAQQGPDTLLALFAEEQAAHRAGKAFLEAGMEYCRALDVPESWKEDWQFYVSAWSTRDQYYTHVYEVKYDWVEVARFAQQLLNGLAIPAGAMEVDEANRFGGEVLEVQNALTPPFMSPRGIYDESLWDFDAYSQALDILHTRFSSFAERGFLASEILIVWEQFSSRLPRYRQHLAHRKTANRAYDQAVARAKARYHGG